MTNSTATYWDVDSQSLNTLAWDITTLGGSRSGVPSMRGANRQVAYRKGSEWRPKVPDSRVLTLAMWVVGWDEDGQEPSNYKTQFNENWNLLQTLLWRPGGEQFTLTKRWMMDAGMITASAEVEFAGGLEPEMGGPHRGAFTVDLFLADPYFYGTEETLTLTKDTPSVEAVAGDAATERIELEFNGSLVNPRVTNSTPTPDIWCQLGMTVNAADSVIVDADQYTAVRQSDDENVIGAVGHSGARQFMKLYRGNNTLELTAASGSGDCDVRYQPAYL